ncbi:MAG TPA: hypothetical protein VNQ78_06380 [Paracoccus sp. (in: a-proteobacteria)]|uniref:hypothetical protein n=1 Tax=Paracoccus sp. TaxID=267 RepID=UPI002B959221|nr:hypothetical protein [Paracoccus sp. (in: a-proteobacteria)]HWL56290.1 hypothetical protein [Paracoccus sp. (in: a-proteobacteria)]
MQHQANSADLQELWNTAGSGRIRSLRMINRIAARIFRRAEPLISIRHLPASAASSAPWKAAPILRDGVGDILGYASFCLIVKDFPSRRLLRDVSNPAHTGFAGTEYRPFLGGGCRALESASFIQELSRESVPSPGQAVIRPTLPANKTK